MRRTTNLLVLLLALMVDLLAVRTIFGGVCSVPTFANAHVFDSGANLEIPGVAALGDVNGDGKLDLVVPVEIYDDSEPAWNGYVSVLLGDGFGNFESRLLSTTPENPVFTAIGDFDGDGKPNLAVAYTGENSGNTGEDGGISVLLGKGNGTFQLARSYPAPYPGYVAVADFNGDGKADVAVACGDGAKTGLLVLLGNGDGTFQNATSILPGPQVYSVVVGDFDHDGHADLAVGAVSGDTRFIAVLRGNGDGTFRTAANYVTDVAGGYGNLNLAGGDLNHDGITDLVAVGSEPVYAIGDFSLQLIGNIRVLLGKGDGTFQQAVRYRAGVGPTFLFISDLNGDGVPDLAVGDFDLWGGFSMLLGNGDGTFQSSARSVHGTDWQTQWPRLFAVGDLNGDGKPDLLLTAASSSVAVSLNSGSYVSPLLAFLKVGRVITWGLFAAVGDFDRDGKLDLALTSPGGTNGTVDFLLGNGDGTWRTGTSYDTG